MFGKTKIITLNGVCSYIITTFVLALYDPVSKSSFEFLVDVMQTLCLVLD